MTAGTVFSAPQEGQKAAEGVEPSVNTYAILGSTGNCGTAIIELLLQTPNVKINAFCRDQAKLLRLIPEVADSKKIEVFQGSIHDVNLLARCAKGCQAVFLLASTNNNVPGCRISQDLAHTIVAALKKLKAESAGFEAPKLVLLSSATIDDHLSRKIPYFRPIMLRAASNVYEDLIQAERFLRAQEDWLSTIYIKPGGLSIDIQRGHKLTLDDEETFLSYLDLAAGMLEAANDFSNCWDGRNVAGANSWPAHNSGSAFRALVRGYDTDSWTINSFVAAGFISFLSRDESKAVEHVTNSLKKAQGQGL